jgi:hypothetical protein
VAGWLALLFQLFQLLVPAADAAPVQRQPASAAGAAPCSWPTCVNLARMKPSL